MMNETEGTALAAMVLSAIWTVVTGDTFFPAFVGAAFATYLRSQSRETGVDRIDLLIGLAASLVIGLIAGPYLASQLPGGEGVVGVGALISAFVAIGFFTRLHALKWDMGVLLREIGGAIGKALSSGEKK